jgi:hypothetical protein
MERKIKSAKFLAKVLDNQFEIAGVKFGVDPILNIIPWFGDIAGTALSLYILNIAREVGVSKIDMMKMIVNIIVDFILGIVPFIGIVFDVVFKANARNIEILEKYSHGKFIEGELI